MNFKAAACALNYQKLHTHTILSKYFYGDTPNDDLYMTICVCFSGHWRVRAGDPNHQHQTLIKAM